MNTKPTVSRAVFRGSVIFVIVLILLFILPDLWNYFTPRQSVHITYIEENYQDAVRKVRKDSRRKRQYRLRSDKYSAPPMAFDPNTYTQEDWMNLGLSEKQAAVVLKFTRYGIRSNEDLKKIVVIPEVLYNLIKDSTRYPERKGKNYPETQVQTAVVKKIDLNRATEQELLSVKGIGPFFARQIIRRRDELGGFHTSSQLLEVWKMDEDRLAQMLPSLTIEPDHLRRININSATTEDLKAHPYISWNLANSIVKLRSQLGSYQRVEDVRKSVLMTDELYEKLKYYLTVDQ